MGTPSNKTKALARFFFGVLAPAPLFSLSEWAEENIVLPASEAARPGRFRNWPYMREILDGIGDPEVEEITVQKATRIGYTTSLVVALAAKIATDPCPICLLVPTDDDARDTSVTHIQPVFDATPAMGGLERGEGTMTRKRYMGGASLKILAARSPRNLRRHGFKVLYADEIDAMETTTEGDPLALSEKRTLAYPDRKMVWGSTPTEEDVSPVEGKYKLSDQRVFEVPCPHCGEFFEILWHHIRYDPATVELDQNAWCQCPAHGCVIEERDKREMVEAGRWRATRPEVIRHRGYRLNALVALLANTKWGQLAAEYEQSRRAGPAKMQVFHNTILAKSWRVSLNKLDAEALAERVEPLGLDAIPSWVLFTTCGADVQDDRIEATVLGWGRSGAPCVLGHAIIDGNTLEDETWAAFDKWLRRTWRHPKGWQLGIDACAVDSGGREGRTQKVYDFCGTRYRRRIFPIKGAAGARPMWKRAEKVKRTARLFIIGHDQAKTEVMERLALEPFDAEGNRDPNAIRLSDSLTEEWFEGVTSETRRVRYLHNRPIIEFVPKRSGIRNEPLDCMCYGWAVRASAQVKSIDLDEREERGTPAEKPKRGPKEWAAALNR